jgi:phenylacetate-coenzyme A ligase PaaK-like adenylate-forming protein
MSPAEVRAMQDRALARAIRELIYPHHRHYRRVMQQSGLGPNDLSRTDHLVRLPFTDRETVAQLCRQEGDPYLFCLERDARATPSTDKTRPVRAFFAGGRTTPLTPIFYSRHDLQQMAAAGQRLFQVAEVDADRPLVNAVPYGPYLPFWQIAATTLDQGITAVQTGGPRVMDVDKTLTALANTRAVTLAGCPNFLTHALKVGARQGVCLEKLERVLITGEPATAGTRRRLREALAGVGAPVRPEAIHDVYLLTEAKTGWAECRGGCGYHTYPDFEFLEVIDPATGQRRGEGETGELVVTHLDARGTFFLRYRTGDIVEGGITTAPCPACGARIPRLGPLVYPAREASIAGMRQALDACEAVGLWQLTLAEGKLTVTASPADPGMDPKQVDGELRRLARQTLGYEPERVEVLSTAELHRRLATDREPREERVTFSAC